MTELTYCEALKYRTPIRERLRVWHSNWKNRHVAKAYRTLVQAMKEDEGFRISWQSNIAMPLMDNSKGRIDHQEANRLADILMAHLFEQKP